MQHLGRGRNRITFHGEIWQALAQSVDYGNSVDDIVGRAFVLFFLSFIRVCRYTIGVGFILINSHMLGIQFHS